MDTSTKSIKSIKSIKNTNKSKKSTNSSNKSIKEQMEQMKINLEMDRLDFINYNAENKTLQIKKYNDEKNNTDKKKSNKSNKSEKKLNKKIKKDKNSKDNTSNIIFEQNAIMKECIYTIDKIMELYPYLRKDYELIKNYVLGKKEQKNFDDYILDKIMIDSIPHYIDRYCNILDTKAKFVGCYIKTDTHLICFLKTQFNTEYDKNITDMEKDILS
jgi:hypothetical protein